MADEERIYLTRKPPVLSREQKTVFGFVVTFGVLALFFGTVYLWKHVASPFVLTYTGPKFLTGDEKQQQEMTRLQQEDTDGDGVNDYDELYVYESSPYLKDSDSDGTEDATEIAQGDDPNCAPKMPCATSTTEGITPTDLRESFLGEMVNEMGTSLGATESSTVPAESTDIAAALASLTIEQIRAFLIQSGGDETTINALTDEQIQAALTAMLAEGEQTSLDSSL